MHETNGIKPLLMLLPFLLSPPPFPWWSVTVLSESINNASATITDGNCRNDSCVFGCVAQIVSSTTIIVCS